MTLSEAVNFHEENQPKGEYVLVIEGAEKMQEENELNSLSVFEHLDFYINQGEDKKSAIKLVARDRGVPKREIYELVMKN